MDPTALATLETFPVRLVRHNAARTRALSLLGSQDQQHLTGLQWLLGKVNAAGFGG